VLATHPGVAEAAVVGVPDERYGARLVAHVVPAGGVPAPTLEELAEHVSGHLARFAVPRELHLTDALPRNATGKVVKRELR
jgi:acyl-coenzyme A synthetase/AMP-(fatty) acid ligase